MRKEKNSFVSLVQFDRGELPDDNLLALIDLYNFGIGSSKLASIHEKWLDAVAALCIAQGHFLELIGMASRSGSQKRNAELSAQRVAGVYSYLVFGKGVSDNQILKLDAIGEDGWERLNVKDGTENAEHRCVSVNVWTVDPGTITTKVRRIKANKIKMSYVPRFR